MDGRSAGRVPDREYQVPVPSPSGGVPVPSPSGGAGHESQGAPLTDWTALILASTPGLNWYQINSEPESGSNWSLTGSADLAFLDSLQVGESAAFVLQGAFEDGALETWSFDFINDLNSATWSRYGNDFRFVVFSSPGTSLDSAKAVGGPYGHDSELTGATLRFDDPYAGNPTDTEDSAYGAKSYFLPLSTGLQSGNPSFTFRQKSSGVDLYTAVVALVRENGTADAAAAASPGDWQPVGFDEANFTPLLQNDDLSLAYDSQGLLIIDANKGIRLNVNYEPSKFQALAIGSAQDGYVIFWRDTTNQKLYRWLINPQGNLIDSGRLSEAGIDALEDDHQTDFNDNGRIGNPEDASKRDSLECFAGSLLLGRGEGPPLGNLEALTLANYLQGVSVRPQSQAFLDRYLTYLADTTGNGTGTAAGTSSQLFWIRLELEASGDAKVATVNLYSEVKATASLRVKPNGEVEDNTYDPRTGLGVELLDSDRNGLVDSLRVHLRDGSNFDDDGLLDGSVQQTCLLAEAPRRTVYRFYNPISGVHFYTPDAAERDNVIAKSYDHSYANPYSFFISAGLQSWTSIFFDKFDNNPDSLRLSPTGWGYKYEGVAYQALDTQGTTLYRFYNASKRYHFLTTDANEANTVIRQSLGAGYDLSNGVNKDPLINGWGYTYEGTSYKVSTIAQHGMDHAVYRFFNVQKQVHFYTSSADERDAVIANSYATGTSYASLSGNGASSEPSGSGWGYRYEGVAWFV